VGITGEELEAGFAQFVHVALGGFPALAGADTGVEGMGDTLHVISGLGLEGGGDGDNATAIGSVAEKKPRKDVGLKFILAGLAREDDDEGETQMVNDGILDGKGDAALVRTELDATGHGPVKRIVTDGLADAEGEG
jgi:hypothetical protein